jgi:hypothetical protein
MNLFLVEMLFLPIQSDLQEKFLIGSNLGEIFYVTKPPIWPVGKR